MSKKRRERLIAGLMLIGMGVGWAFGYLVPGLFIGLGLGYIASEFIGEKEKGQR